MSLFLIAQRYMGGLGVAEHLQLTLEALDQAQSLPLSMAVLGEIPVETS